MLARLMFAIVDFTARNGLAEVGGEDSPKQARQRARRTGVRGETYAYWYLRRQGYVLVGQNYRAPGLKGEIDLIGYDGPILAFVEVKTRKAGEAQQRPEEAVNAEKRHHLVRMARQFAGSRRVDPAKCRFDVLAIETRPGMRPAVRLHKGAFSPEAAS